MLGLGVLGALTFPGICYLCQRPRHCHSLISGEVNTFSGETLLLQWLSTSLISLHTMVLQRKILLPLINS